MFDAGNTLSLSYFGSNNEGVSLNLSGTVYYNGALSLNDANFKAFTADQETISKTNTNLVMHIGAPQ